MAVLPTTRWTRILRERGDPQLREQLTADLLQQYWQPLYVYVRRMGKPEQEAHDVVQGICLRLLERGFLDRVDKSKGKLRTYLLTAARHYLADEAEKRKSLKRGGAFAIEQLDTDWAERNIAHSTSVAPDEAYERAWAQLILERAHEQLRQEFETGTRKGPFSLFEEAFRGDTDVSQSELAEKYGMTRSQLKSFLFRARNRLKELAHEAIQQTVEDPSDVEQESQFLHTRLGATSSKA